MTVVPDILLNFDFRKDIRGETGGSVDHALRRMVEEALESLNEIVVEKAPKKMKVDTVARHVRPMYRSFEAQRKSTPR